MPRKKGSTVGSKTLIVRVSELLDNDLRTAAEGLGVDVSNLVRMILIENVPTYIERGLGARRRAESARAKSKQNARPAGKPDKGKPAGRPMSEGPDEGDRRSLNL